MMRPLEPKKEDCCSSGCNPCIFDIYEKQLKLYESYIENGESDLAEISENAISQLEYTKFYVVNNIDLENEHKLILFRQSNSCNVKIIWEPGDHFLIKYVSEEQNCTRAYTPLKINLEDSDKYDFAVLIKVYFDGVVSNYLSCLNKGDITLWRGPYGNYKPKPNIFSRIIMIAQGTGIAPLYSIIKQIINNEEDMTKILLVYCCKNLNTMLLRDELYSFKSYWNFNYEVYLKEKLTESCKYQEPIFPHKFEFSSNKFKSISELDQFILCGSNKFMDHFKQLLLKENVDEASIFTF